MANLFQIGDVVERTGLSHRALHYYEEIGLLVPSVKLDGGMRLYSEQDLHRIARILELRELLGLSLREIKRILEAEESRALLLETARREPAIEGQRADLERALAIADEQLAHVRGRIQQMQLFEGRLAAEVRTLRETLESLPTGNGK